MATNRTRPRLQTGLDVVASQGFSHFRGSRTGVLTNQCGVTRAGEHILELLARAGTPPAVVLSPEHGLWSTHQDMEPVSNAFDPVFGSPVLSLYGNQESSLVPDRTILDSVDVLLVDLQDIGSRYYTYAATVVKILRVLSGSTTRVVVLDRPNPIDGLSLEGSILKEEMRSFVGELPVPQRHGMTLGELAQFAHRREKLDVDLFVVRLDHWPRASRFEDLGLIWVPPSPNMPRPITALLYPGLCLLEGTNVSEGRGTTTPFEVFGAPWIDPISLAERISLERASAGFVLTSCSFRPQFGKFAGEICRGLRVHITNPQDFAPFYFGLALLKWMFRLFPDDFEWREVAYEFVSDRLAIDLLLGDPAVREMIQEGEEIVHIRRFMEDALHEFREERIQDLLY